MDGIYKKRNDYSVSVFLTNGKVMKKEYVQNLFSWAVWLEEHNVQWKYMNVYERRGIPGQNFIARYYYGKYIPPYPRRS